MLVERGMAVFSLGVGGKASVGSRHSDAESEARGVLCVDHAVVIQHQISGRLVRVLRVTRNTTALEDRLDVAEVLYGLHARLETQASLFARVPLLARFVELPAREQRRLDRQIEYGVIRLPGGG